MECKDIHLRMIRISCTSTDREGKGFPGFVLAVVTCYNELYYVDKMYTREVSTFYRKKL